MGTADSEVLGSRGGAIRDPGPWYSSVSGRPFRVEGDPLIRPTVLALCLLAPTTSQATSVVLTPAGGNPLTDGVRSLDASAMGAGPVVFDLYLDIAGRPGDVPNQTYADDLANTLAFVYEFEVEANLAQGVAFVPSGSSLGHRPDAPRQRRAARAGPRLAHSENQGWIQKSCDEDPDRPLHPATVSGAAAPH